MKSGRDTPNNIPSMLLDPGTPAATPRTDATTLGLLLLLQYDQWPATLGSLVESKSIDFQGFSSDFQKFPKNMIFMRKIKVVKSVTKCF